MSIFSTMKIKRTQMKDMTWLLIWMWMVPRIQTRLHGIYFPQIVSSWFYLTLSLTDMFGYRKPCSNNIQNVRIKKENMECEPKDQASDVSSMAIDEAGSVKAEQQDTQNKLPEMPIFAHQKP
ncbi:hypothetical protein BHE74_00028393 [Ensete ventricosum]|nr:hypothetical protein BHE74_00028393 [Ensete ventricosum]RZS08174.1 hypothetical protein BHM03_00039111 [Ensete ventricosum]